MDNVHAGHAMLILAPRNCSTCAANAVIFSSRTHKVGTRLGFVGTSERIPSTNIAWTGVRGVPAGFAKALHIESSIAVLCPNKCIPLLRH